MQLIKYFKGFILALFCLNLNGQVSQKKDSLINPWISNGKVSLLASQSSFENWTAGGVNNISATIGLNYDFNYTKEKWRWDNKLIASFGITKLNGQDIQKSDDRLQFNSVLGIEASENWYYSLFLNFKTQFADDLNRETKGPTTIFSPAFIQFGPGMLWKKNDYLKINIAPVTSRLIIVDKSLTLPNKAYFGVTEGKSSRYELGGSINAYYKTDLMENVSCENILNLFVDYLEETSNVDFDYTLNIVMTINKYLTTNLALQAIYDDNAFRGLQLRQVFGLGVNYHF